MYTSSHQKEVYVSVTLEKVLLRHYFILLYTSTASGFLILSPGGSSGAPLAKFDFPPDTPISSPADSGIAPSEGDDLSPPNAPS